MVCSLLKSTENAKIHNYCKKIVYAGLEYIHSFRYLSVSEANNVVYRPQMTMKDTKKQLDNKRLRVRWVENFITLSLRKTTVYMRMACSLLKYTKYSKINNYCKKYVYAGLEPLIIYKYYIVSFEDNFVYCLQTTTISTTKTAII